MSESTPFANQDWPVVDDDAIHIENPKLEGTTLCQQTADRMTNLGTLDELRADHGDACWSCLDAGNRIDRETQGTFSGKRGAR